MSHNGAKPGAERGSEPSARKRKSAVGSNGARSNGDRPAEPGGKSDAEAATRQSRPRRRFITY